MLSPRTTATAISVQIEFTWTFHVRNQFCPVSASPKPRGTKKSTVTNASEV